MARKKQIYQIVQLKFHYHENKREEYIERYMIETEIDISENQVAALIEEIKGRYYEYDDVHINFIPELLQLDFSKYPEDEQRALIDNIFDNGYEYNKKIYVRLCKSSSMARVNKLILIEKSMFNQIRNLISLNLHDRFKTDESIEVVFSKFESYLGLALSSVLLIDYVPQGVCIVPEFKQFIDMPYVTMKEDNDAPIVKKGIDITLHDGMGIHSPNVGCEIAKALGIKKYVPVAYQLRVYPAIKGVSVEFDFKSWCAEREVTHITDIFNKEWAVDEIDCIWSASMFKFAKYFDSWHQYDELRRTMYEPLHQYNIGIAKWVKPDVPAMVTMNYQFLQCLNLKGRDLVEIAKYTTDKIEDIYKNDVAAAITFLGLVSKESSDADEETIAEEIEHKMLSSNIITALETNPDELFIDPCVKKHLIRALEKTITNLKLGKPFVSGANMVAIQDPLLFLESITDKERIGALKSGEFYSTGLVGERGIFRSPCIHTCQPCKGNFVDNDLTAKWFSKYKNIIVFNGFDLAAAQQSSEDFDGDTNFVINDERINNAIITDYKIIEPVLIDIGLRDNDGNVRPKAIKYIKTDEDGKPLINELGDYVMGNLWHEFTKPNYPIINESEKDTAQQVRYSEDNLRHFEKESLENKISTITNLSTLYVNLGAAKGNPDRYYNDLVKLGIMQGIEIDAAKTGIHAELTKKMQKDSRYIPYFMKYKYPYRKKTDYSDYAYSSPMNKLCRYIEAWESKLLNKKGKCYLFDNTTAQQYKKVGKYLMDEEILKQDEALTQKAECELKSVMDDFYKEKSKLFHSKIDNKDAWSLLYKKYGIIVDELPYDKRLLASICVLHDYLNKKDSKRSCQFVWSFLFDGLLPILAAKQVDKKTMVRAYKDEDEIPKDASTIQDFEGKKYYTFSINYLIDDSISQKLKDKKKLKPLVKEISVVGLDEDMTPDKIVELLKLNNKIILHDRPYEDKKGKTIHATGIYQDGIYLGSVKASDEYCAKTLVDIASYKDQEGILNITAIAKSSYKGLIKLMV